jgi:hypothetical protein
LNHDDPAFRNVYAKFDDTARLRADTETRAKLYDTLAKWGAVSPNEMRAMEDLPRLDDDAADKTYIQSGFTTIENAADTSMTDGQLAQLVSILTSVASGELPGDAAEPLILHVWPQILPEIVAQMIAAAAEKASEKAPKEPVFAPVLPPPDPENQGSEAVSSADSSEIDPMGSESIPAK